MTPNLPVISPLPKFLHSIENSNYQANFHNTHVVQSQKMKCKKILFWPPQFRRSGHYQKSNIFFHQIAVFEYSKNLLALIELKTCQKLNKYSFWMKTTIFDLLFFNFIFWFYSVLIHSAMIKQKFINITSFLKLFVRACWKIKVHFS